MSIGKLRITIGKMCFEIVCIHKDNLEYTLHLHISVNLELVKEQRRENNNKRKKT